MSERSRWQDVLTAHLHDQQPLTSEEVNQIRVHGVAPVSDFEQRLTGKWWHSSFPPFPEGWTEDGRSTVEVGEVDDIPQDAVSRTTDSR